MANGETGRVNEAVVGACRLRSAVRPGQPPTRWVAVL